MASSSTSRQGYFGLPVWHEVLIDRGHLRIRCNGILRDRLMRSAKSDEQHRAREQHSANRVFAHGLLLRMGLFLRCAAIARSAPIAAAHIYF
jgi:hypothetical protein